MENILARTEFEKNYKRVSRSTWYRIKSIFNEKYPLTIENIREIALIKKAIPKLNEYELKNYVNNQIELFNNEEKISGKQILKHIENKYNLNEIPSYTVSRWFKHIGGYKRDKFYDLKIIKFISYQAFLYAKRREKI